MNVNIPNGPIHMTEEQRKQIEKDWVSKMHNHPWLPTIPEPLSAQELAALRMQDEMHKAMTQKASKRAKVAEFRESYIKIRTDNIVLTHETAIVLVKQIMSDADTLTYEDTL